MSGDTRHVDTGRMDTGHVDTLDVRPQGPWPARVTDARLPVAVALAWITVAWALQTPVILPVLLWAAIVIALALTVCAARAGRAQGVRLLRWLAPLSLAAAAVALIVASAVAQSDARDGDALDGCHEFELVLEGRPSDPHTRARIESAASAPGCNPVTGLSVPVLLLDGGVALPADAPLGSRWRVTGDVVAVIEGGTFAALISLDDAPVHVDSPWWSTWAGHVRAQFAAQAAGLAGDGAHLVMGMALGDTSLVRPELESAMRASSLTHLTAVSGANCAIVVGAVVAIAALCGARRGVRVALAGLALGAFVVLVTPEPSVIRAATMTTVALFALVFGRPTAGLAALSLATVVLVVVDPWLTVSLGFQLSAAASAALLILAPPIAVRLGAWWGDRVPRPLVVLIAASLAAQLACTPLLVPLDGHLRPWGVLANLVAVPLAGIITVIGMLACIALVLMPPLAPVLIIVAAMPAQVIATTATLVSGLPGAGIPWPSDAWGVACALGVSTGIATVLLTARHRVGLAIATLGVVVLGALPAGAPTLAVSLTVPDWRVAQCDVGQGDAVLVRSAGAVALIDTGADPERLERCLALFGIEHIALLVLTHFDHDHVGGVDAVIGTVGTVLHSVPGDAMDAHTLERLSEGGAAIVPASDGMTGTLGAAQWTILWPPAIAPPPPGNDASVVIGVEGDGISLIALGDLGAETQREVLDGHPGTYAIVKVSHHGSADQLPALYAAIGAEIALIGVGDNTYGHPTSEALQLLEGAGALVIRTDLHGAAALGPLDEHAVASASAGPEVTIEVWCERHPP